MAPVINPHFIVLAPNAHAFGEFLVDNGFVSFWHEEGFNKNFVPSSGWTRFDGNGQNIGLLHGQIEKSPYLWEIGYF